MKVFMIAIVSMFAFSVQASEMASEMVIEEILLNTRTGEKAMVMSCTCYRGPGQGQPYSCQAVAKTCYGGPGNYPYTCYVCAQ